MRTAARSALAPGAEFLPYPVRAVPWLGPVGSPVRSTGSSVPGTPTGLMRSSPVKSSPAREGDSFRWEWEERMEEEGWTPSIRGSSPPVDPRIHSPKSPEPALPSQGQPVTPPQRLFPIFEKGFVPPRARLGLARATLGSRGSNNSVVVSSININGFDPEKQEWVADYISRNKVDIMVVVDTRLSDGESGWAKRRISQILGKGVSFACTIRGINVPSATPGGIIIISMPRMGNVIDKKDDPLKVGSRLATLYKLGPLPITVLGVYVPFSNKKKPKKPPADLSMSLEHRMSRAPEGRGGQFAHYKPVDYLWRHIGVVASRTMQFPLASLIVAGDFNGTFGPSKSSYQDMAERSSAAGLVRS